MSAQPHTLIMDTFYASIHNNYLCETQCLMIAACKVNVCGCTVSIKYGKSSKLNHNIYRMHMYILLTGYSQGPVRTEGFFAWAADTFYWQVQ